jgi:hypothetical protein
MANHFSRPATHFMVFTAIVTWLALGLQLYLMVGNKLHSLYQLLHGVFNYFSYFTILTNSLVAISLTLILLWPRSKPAAFFSRSPVLAAINVYIFLVALIYNILLRNTWNPRGYQRWADDALHVIIPVLFFIFWFLYVRKGTLNWRHPFRWLIYPACYLVFALMRGEFTRFHAYHFINTGQLGYPRVILNAGMLMMVFILAGCMVVGLDKLMAAKRSVTAG